MPEYAPGTPSWVELSSPDTDAAAGFYGELMGWRATEPGGAQTGGYRMFQQDGKNVAGLMGHMREGQPTAWATYVSVANANANADETAAKVRAAGGTVVLEPMDVMDIGRMAFFVNEPNSLCWNEVLTRAPDQGRELLGCLAPPSGKPAERRDYPRRGPSVNAGPAALRQPRGGEPGSPRW